MAGTLRPPRVRRGRQSNEAPYPQREAKTYAKRLDRLLSLGIDTRVAAEALCRFPDLAFEQLLEQVVATCADSLLLPSVSPAMSSRLRLFPSQKRRDLATLSDIIEKLETSRRPPTRTFPFVDAPSAAAGYGDARTDQLMAGLAAGRSATLGNGAQGSSAAAAADHAPASYPYHGSGPQHGDAYPHGAHPHTRFPGLAAAYAAAGSSGSSAGGAAGNLAAATAALRLGSPHSSFGSNLSPDEYSDTDSAHSGSHASAAAAANAAAAAGMAPQRSRSGSVWCYPDQPLYIHQSLEGLSEVNQATRERAAACRYYIQQHYIHLHRARVERIRRRRDIEEEMLRQHLPEDQRVKVRTALIHKESEYLRRLRAPIHLSLFAPLKRIGRGAFGEVTLVRGQEDDRVYAMKTLRKSDVIARQQVAHVKAERDILAEADNEWVVRLHYSFQDHRNLYFVMDYVPGGDLMHLLTKARCFPEKVARFFLAELIMAISSVHAMGFIHRDIKPDNILIDADGHIKLTDFGLCTGFRWTQDRSFYGEGTKPAFTTVADLPCPCNLICTCGSTAKVIASQRQHTRSMAESLVGTPNYIAPEVFQRRRYDHRCDWWSVGVILYEMLIGRPPFFAATPEATREKVINWHEHLKIPQQSSFSHTAKDLILRLCCEVDHRLGSTRGVQEIREHAFFEGLRWDRTNEPFFVPELSDDTDTTHFESARPLAAAAGAEDDVSWPAALEEDDSLPDAHYNMFREFNFRRFWSGPSGASSRA